MGDNDPAPWEDFAPLLARQGYLVITYSFRYPLRTASFTTAMATGTVADLSAAVAYARGAGARRLVLIGASLGGITTGKLASVLRADAVVILSAPLELAEYGLVVTSQELLAMTMPKLFVASEHDGIVALATTRAFYDHAPGPKQWQSYPGDAHGVRIFATTDGEALRQLLLEFVLANAPA
jgi:predicted alpha/beta-hydrolase family hydrolase